MNKMTNDTLDSNNSDSDNSNSDNSSIITCHQLSKVYQQGDETLTVLDNLNFSIAAGERVAIIGTSGSGKTTLLNLLGGIDKPSSGQVLIANQDISKFSSDQQDNLRNKMLGFVYQFHHLLGEFNAQENVAMPLIISGEEYDICMKKSEQLLTRVGLKDRLNHKPSQLSGGERQRVAIARALANNPACVLMDEPTGNLDHHTALAIHELMSSIREDSSTSFIIVTHDQKLAQQMDRVMVLENGQLKPQTKDQ